MTRKNFIFIVLLMFNCACFGQPLIFKQLTTTEGLLSDLRLTMAEDRLGRLWIGSDEGVNVFDGYELGSFSQPDRSGLASNSIQNIFCDKAGTIWIITSGGVQYKRETESSFTSLPDTEKDINNTIFFGQTSGGELLCVTRSNIYKVSADLAVTKLNSFSALFKSHSGPLCFNHLKNDEWFIGFGRSLVLVNITTQKIIKEYNYRSAWTVCQMSDSTIMVGSFARDSVVIINLRSGRSEPINNWTTSDGEPIAGFTGTIVNLGGNKFALGCRLHGVYIVDSKRKYAQHYMPDPGDPTSLKSRFTRRLFLTSGGTLVVHAKGLSYTQITPPQINNVRHLITNKAEKYDGGFNSFVQDSKGMMWVGTNIGLAKWDRKTDVSTFFPYYLPKEGPQKFKTIRAVTVDKLDRIWVGTFGGGLGMLKPDGSYEQFTRDSINPGRNLPSLEILAISKDKVENFILCTNRGFAYFDPIEKKITSFSDHAILKSISVKQSNYALADDKNNWWLVQTEAVYYYDIAGEHLHKVIFPEIYKDKIGFNTITQDSSGNSYIGSTMGLFVIKKGSLTPELLLSKKDGLPSDKVIGLVYSKNGTLWILGNRGMARYNIRTRVLQNLGTKDGAEITNHAFMNFYMTPDDELYAGSTLGGFNHFYPDSLVENKNSLKVFISSVSLPDSIINISDNYDFSFEYYQNNLSFSFVTIDFSIAPFVQYRYKLIGFDTAFIYNGKQRLARYTNLAAGNYSFIVEASDNGRDWYPAQHPLKVKIGTAFWNSWWFKLLLLLFTGGIIYFAYRYRIGQVNKEARLKTEYEIKLNELEISALRTQMNPHFIFNSLNTINSFINSNDRVQANQYISKFSRLIRLILDHSRKKKIALADEMNVVELYMQMEQIRFEHKFSFSIINNTAIDTDTVEIPPLIIQPFVENAILHGLLPSDEPGLLSVTLTKTDNRIVCTIEDNGIGRERAKLNKSQDTAKRESHGMEITLKRIDLFNKENNMPLAVTIEDLQNPTGTKVSIPLALVESF